MKNKYQVAEVEHKNKKAERERLKKVSTVKPVLSGPPIKRTPFIKRTLAWVPKFSYNIYCITNLY